MLILLFGDVPGGGEEVLLERLEMHIGKVEVISPIL